MKEQEHTILLRVGELWLKGKNQRSFVDRLLSNIRGALARNSVEVTTLKHQQGSIFLVCTGEKEEIVILLGRIPGISIFSFVEVLDCAIENVDDVIGGIFDAWKKEGVTSIRFDTRRRDKQFALTSPEINARLGAIAKEKGLKCDYKNATHTVSVIVMHDAIFVSSKTYRGMGGLPVGSSGKGLVLLSGGIDSPVSALRMMRRGVHVDYIHFHTFAQNDALLRTKIPTIIRQLNRFAPRCAVLYSVPYTFFDLAAQEHIPQRMQVIFFKNFMHHFAQEILQRDGYQMMINGDALAQVASQTPENMHAAMHDVRALLLRPLVSMDKEEIITLSRQYGLYEQSIKPYKDCCSLVAKNPLTRVSYDKFLTVATTFPLQQVIQATMEQVTRYEITDSDKNLSE